MSVYEKLSRIQRELIAPKGQRNDFGKYNYRSCEDILKALKPIADENGCVVYITNDLLEIGGRHYVKATVTLTDLESNESIVSTAHAREEDAKKGMDGSQITGASSSYARKYALAGLFCIDNEKDSDATNTGDKPAAKKSTQDTEIPWESVQDILVGNGIDLEFVCGLYSVKCLADLSAEKKSNIMKHIKDIKAKQEGKN